MAFRKPTHEKLVKMMYPPVARCNERFLKPENVGRLQSYALRNPKILPEIGRSVLY